MDRLKQAWTQIKHQLQGLPPTSKWLIASLLTIMVMTVFIVSLYVGRDEEVAIGAFTSDRSDVVMTSLQQAGVKASFQGNQLMVPAQQHETALMVLAQRDLLNEDTSQAFNELLKDQSPWTTQAEKNRAYNIARQQVLSRVIGKMNGVRSASVVVDMPQEKGFAEKFIHPSGMVTITPRSGQRLDKHMVKAVASLVAGSVAGMSPTDVTVIDAVTNRSFTVQDERDLVPTEAAEFRVAQEQYYERKLRDLLQYIPGVLIAVQVQTDDIHTKTQTQRELEKNEPLLSTEKREFINKAANTSGEPGTRPNVGMSIAGGTNQGTESSENFQRDEFGAKVVVGETRTTHTGHNIQKINVTVNVPRGYFVNLFRAENPDTQNPSDQDLQGIMTAQLTMIESQVRPQIDAVDDGMIQVNMIPDATVFPQATLATNSGILAVLESPMARPAMIGGMMLVTLAFMFFMVRKATQPESLPSVEELAGVPPTLPGDDELVGEVEEFESSMAGVEVGEDELESRRIAEQISELVKENPREAGTLIKRWVNNDD